MKKVKIILLASMFFSAAFVTTAQNSNKKSSMSAVKSTHLTTQERDSAVQLMQATMDTVFSTVKDLTETQLKFKPDSNSWSVEECVKHIAAAETVLWPMMEETLEKP